MVRLQDIIFESSFLLNVEEQWKKLSFELDAYVVSYEGKKFTLSLKQQKTNYPGLLKPIILVKKKLEYIFTVLDKFGKKVG